MRLLTVPNPTDNRSKLYDRPDSFGWASIALHWLAAALVILLWFLGKSIASQPLDEIDARRTLHVTVGLVAWLLLALRIGWRLWSGHPQVAGQSLHIHRFAKTVHYFMLAVLTCMLLSGPFLALAYADNSGLNNVARFIHACGANLLYALVVLHILGALKHLMFHDDDTIVRMLWPNRRGKP